MATIIKRICNKCEAVNSFENEFCSNCGNFLIKNESQIDNQHDNDKFEDNIPVNKYNCNFCGKLIELDEEELSGKDFVCPVCNRSTNIGLINRVQYRKKNINMIVILLLFSCIIMLFFFQSCSGPVFQGCGTTFGGAIGLCIFPLIITFLVLLHRKQGIYDKDFALTFFFAWLFVVAVLLYQVLFNKQ